MVLETENANEKERIVYRSWNLEGAKLESLLFLAHFDPKTVVNSINDIMEIYNVYRILTDLHDQDNNKQQLKLLYSSVARFFKAISDDNFCSYHEAVDIEYYDEFLDLIENFESYKNITDEGFVRIFSQNGFTLYKILEHKKLVAHYDKAIAEYMRTSDQSAEVIIRCFLEKKSDKSNSYYIPKSLEPTEFEGIIWRYIDSDFPHVNLVSLVSYSLSKKECPLSDELRLHAKKRSEELISRPGMIKSVRGYGIGVSFEDIDVIKKRSTPKPDHYLISYDVKWLKENLDQATILNNFIYLFEFCNRYMLCNFPVVQSTFGVFERIAGVTGIQEYKTGIAFREVNNFARLTMHTYYNFLLQHHISIEEVIQWFFSTYMKDEFGIKEFVVNIPANSYTNLDKCRLLPSELDGILKQFSMLVNKGEIDRELLEISSNSVSYRNVPSLIPNKYTYVENNDLYREMKLCFSDQSMLSYVKKYNDSCTGEKSFVKLALIFNLNINDYDQFSHNDILWLNKRGVIELTPNGDINLNCDRIMILKSLYDHEVIRTSQYENNAEFNRMLDNGDLITRSTLFSIPEQDFLNYMLNKSEFSNGKDLRNKYIHSTYPKDKDQHYNDYIDILRISIVVIIKINEELCYLDENRK